MTDEQPGTPEPAGTDVAGGTSPGLGWLDVAGVVAAVLLAAILADIWTDGRFLSARLLGRGRPEGGSNAPKRPAGD